MKMSKVIKILVIKVIMAVLTYVIKKGKFSLKSSRTVSDIPQVASDATTNEEKSFGGLKQSEIDEVAINTSRGVKAEIIGDILEYSFKSGSGKQTPTAQLKIEEGEPVFTFISFFNAHSPHSFKKNLRDAMKQSNKVK